MKTILTISLILIGMIGKAQEIRLDRWYYILAAGDTSYFNDYVYDSSNILLAIYVHDHITQDTVEIRHYRNDTLVKVIRGRIYDYVYLDDTVVELIHFAGEDTSYSAYYKMNDKNEVIKTQGCEYIWNGSGNCVQGICYGETSYNHYSTHINPWYNQKKYFKYGGFGSYNMPKGRHTPTLSVSIYVIESILNYPTVAEFYGNDEHVWTYHFEYRNMIDDVQEMPFQPHTVLALDYYDILGRKISKPTQGFYIECKTTDKGVMVKKYYIQ